MHGVCASGHDRAIEFDPYHKWLGIAPHEQPPNLYRLLGVALHESDPDVIAHAADARMSHVKTFQGGKHSVLSQQLLNEIAAARVTLLNPEKRAEYDLRLEEQAENVRRDPPLDAIRINIRPTRTPLRKNKAADWFLIFGLLGLAAIVLIVVLPVYLNRKSNANIGQNSTAARRNVSEKENKTAKPPANSPPLDHAELVELVEPSVVIINTVKDGIGRGVGSGFVVNAEGFVATNYHVIKDASSATVKFRDGRAAEVKGYVAADESRDLAVLSIDMRSQPKLNPLEISKKLPKKGEPVMAFGSPQGLEFSVTRGIVSAIRSRSNIQMIQMDAPISPGNSGGPLVSAKGQVVGIVVGYREDGQNLNFAVSAVELERLTAGISGPPRPLKSLSLARRSPPRKVDLPPRPRPDAPPKQPTDLESPPRPDPADIEKTPELPPLPPPVDLTPLDEPEGDVLSLRAFGRKLSAWLNEKESQTTLQKSDDRLKDFVKELNDVFAGKTLDCSFAIEDIKKSDGGKYILNLENRDFDSSWCHFRERWTFPLNAKQAKQIQRGCNLKLNTAMTFKLGYCPECRGSGLQPCNRCNGRGYNYEEQATTRIIPGSSSSHRTYKNVKVPCTACFKTGKVKCHCHLNLGAMVDLRSGKPDVKSALLLSTDPRVRCYILFDAWRVAITDKQDAVIYEAIAN